MGSGLGLEVRVRLRDGASGIGLGSATADVLVAAGVLVGGGGAHLRIVVRYTFGVRITSRVRSTVWEVKVFGSVPYRITAQSYGSVL